MDEAIDLARQKILPFRVNRGQVIDFSITANNADGTPYDFTGHTAEMYVYNSFAKTDTPEYTIEVVLSSGTIAFSHEAITRRREDFVYQLWITNSSGYRQPWINGPFLVLNREWDHEDGEDTIVISPDGDNVTLTITPLSGGGGSDLSNVQEIVFNPSPSGDISPYGLRYNSADHSLDFQNDETESTLQIGQENWIRVYNNSGATIVNGRPVYTTGVEGVEFRPTVALALADAEATARVIGITTHDIENNSFGYVTVFGKIRNFDTSGFLSGDALFLSASVAGSMTSTRPSNPNYAVFVGYVIRSHATLGTIIVNISLDPNTPASGGGTINGVALNVNRLIPSPNFIKRTGKMISAAITQESLTLQVLTANTLRAWPIDISVPTVLTTLHMEVTTGVGSTTCRIGLYADNGSNYPGAKIADHEADGTIDTSSNGVKTKALTGGVISAPGRYWQVENSNGAPTLRSIQKYAMNSAMGLATALGSGNQPLGWSAALAYGSLPDNFPAGATLLTVITPAIGWEEA